MTPIYGMARLRPEPHGKRRAYYRFGSADFQNGAVLSRVATATHVMCSQGVDPRKLREHTDALLFANDSLHNMPDWGAGHWERYRDFWEAEDGSTFQASKNANAQLTVPTLHNAEIKAQWLTKAMDERPDQAGVYLDMAGRGTTWWVKNDLEVPDFLWPRFTEEYAACLSYFIRRFRHLNPDKLLLVNTWGPSKGESARKNFGVERTLFATEDLKLLDGICIEHPRKRDLTYYRRARRVIERSRGECHNITWGAEGNAHAMPGDLFKEIEVEA
jgi:hypothetical protein